MCAQSKRIAVFWFVKLLRQYKGCVFKTSTGVHFSLDKLDVDKLVPGSDDLSKLNNLV